jgi:hypothetical protein
MKILPIIVQSKYNRTQIILDDNIEDTLINNIDSITRELSLFSVFHYKIYLHHDENIKNPEKNVINFQDIFETKLEFLEKIIITSDEELLTELEEKFPEYNIYLVGKATKRLKLGIINVHDINSIITEYKSEGYQFYTKKEIEIFTSRKDLYEEKRLQIILTGETKNTQISLIKNVIDKIKMIKLIDNKYVIKQKDIIFTGEKKDMMNKYLNLKSENIYDMSDLEKEFNHSLNIQRINRDNACKYEHNYNLANINKLRYHWYGLQKILNNENIFNSEIYLILDISQLNSQIKNINLHKIFTNIINNTNEIIYIEKDMCCIGTKKIIKHYCNMFDCYNTYSFKSEERNITNDIIFGHEKYQKITNRNQKSSLANIFEHISFFGDLVLCDIIPLPIETQITKKNKKIILVTYYGIYEQFDLVKESLNRYDYDIVNFSYMHWFQNFGIERMEEEMKQLIDGEKPDYILWWTLNIPAQNLQKIHKYNRKIKHLYFNWDEPFNYDLVDMKNKAKYLTHAFITCQETTTNYIKHGALNCYCVYPGYSKKIHYPHEMKDNKIFFKKINYRHDISFVLTNLYDNKEIYPDQIVNRKKIVDTLYHNQKGNYSFAIYGPEKFKNEYPISYQDFIKYEDTGNLFNQSKINICTHVIGNKKGYLNERIFLILASGGLLLVDPIPGVDDILVNGYNCIFIEENKIVSQIKHILKNNAYYDKIRLNAYKTAKKYTWDDWALRIIEKL